MKYFLIICLLSFFFLGTNVYAHQPRMIEGNTIQVENPEISKAYYSQLTGEPHVYSISSPVSFELYVNVLVPYADNQPKDTSFRIINTTTEEVIDVDGTKHQRTTFFEPFGYDTYWKGPEYKKTTPAGDYEIVVSSTTNDSTYSLAVGEKEIFDITETINALTLIPKIKREFFGYAPTNFILSPLGWGYILIMFVGSFLFGFLYRWSLKLLAKKSPIRSNKNIDTSGRLIRLLSGVVLLLIAISTSWSPILLFFAGFCFFEAMFSRCGLYAALGKSSCPA